MSPPLVSTVSSDERVQKATSTRSATTSIEFPRLYERIYRLIRDAFEAPRPLTAHEMRERMPLFLRAVHKLREQSALDDTDAAGLIREYIAATTSMEVQELVDNALETAFDTDALLRRGDISEATMVGIWSSREEKRRRGLAV